MSEIKNFKNNETYILVDEDGYEVECCPRTFTDGDKKYAYFQMFHGNSNECFLVSIFEADGNKKMRLITEEEFKTVERVYLEHPFTSDYYPIEIDEQDFSRGYYKNEKDVNTIKK